MLTAVTTTLLHPLCGKPLTIATVDPTALELLRRHGGREVRLDPPIHVSEHDAYLLVPSGSLGADPATWIDRALVVCGDLEVSRGRARLSIATRWDPRALVEDKPFDATVAARGADLLAQINRLPFASCSAGGRLFDRRGLDRVLRSTSFLGTSCRASVPEGEAAGADPSWVWSRRHRTTVSVHVAVLGEYEERYCLINPVRVRL